MSNVIKPNWEVFKAKFSENPQNNFEWFCYLLFCKEFGQAQGIFRFKNQHAIETNPIQINNEVIGWQAKFYDTPLSTHKRDLIKTVIDAKNKYTNITTLHLYTNKEWSQSKSGASPAALIEINQKAKKIGVDLIWKTTGFFESEFVSVKNKIFSNHFFTFEKSIFDVIIEQQKHTESILNSIQTYIAFKNKTIEIDRNKDLEKLKDKYQKISIVSGTGGVGKTVLIKKLYEQFKGDIPLYVFKANEFELRDINELYKEFSLYDFSEAHKDDSYKIIVIDSAEKLLDLKNTDPFKNFLSVLVKENWTIIFTTRDHYLDDLNYQFFEIYNIAPLNIGINNLELDELNTISAKHSFLLPKDEKLLELIRSPFYLNEYLKFYDDYENIEYSRFKNKIWDRNIKKSEPKRERCFLQIASERANRGQFFVSPNSESNALNDELVRDGILGYETAGYFITHDIYEEWALEKIIESQFIKKTGNDDFFTQIGQSLSVRRCFRNWLSEKLLLKNVDIKRFIEDVVESDEVPAFWKDEILVSILLSDYSETFFVIFKDELLANEQNLLKKLSFILRTACKEVDDDLFKQLGIKNLNLLSLKYVLTKPKGNGWECIIKFVFEHIEIIGFKNINFLLPIIHDWNSKVKKGKTTRFSSLIALQYYQWTINENHYFSHDDTQKHLLQTIMYGAFEIKSELKIILDDVKNNKWKKHSDPYCDLSKVILSEMEGVHVSIHLPEEVLSLADLFWSYSPDKKDCFYSSHLEMEHHFGLEHSYRTPFPASAYQTPIYSLLNFHRQNTVDFIIDFVNKSIQRYSSSNFDHSIQEVTVFLNNGHIQKQYISNCLWNLYRGTGSPVSPYLLQSIHMALEKHLLEFGEKAKADNLENWLLYLLKHSKSASITSVVTSIVLAYPEKTFNVARVLFQTKEFVIADTDRLVAEAGARSLYSIGRNMGARHNDIYDDERVKTCGDKHRKLSLESLFLNYQLFRSQETSESDCKERQSFLWEILDNYYKKLPPEPEQTTLDKTWRLFLARMDKRKMNITTEKADGGVAIHFNPELEPDLKDYSEQSLEQVSEDNQYMALKIWADYRFNADNKHKDYKQYEESPQLALKETREIVRKLIELNAQSGSETSCYEKEKFNLFNQSTPAYVCSILLRDYIDELTIEEKSFCRDIVLETSFSALQPNYQYQISDGVQPAISVLPILIEIFPEEKESIKLVLLLNMFNDSHVGSMLSTQCFSVFPTTALQGLWETNFSCAQSLFLGYLLLKPKYEELIKTIHEENYSNATCEPQWDQLINRFLEDNAEDFENVAENRLSFSNLQDTEKYDLSILRTAFRMSPNKVDNEDHKIIVKEIISTFAQKFALDNRGDEIDFQIKHDFLQTYAYFVLSLPTNEIEDYIKPFIDYFEASESMAELFNEFVAAQDRINAYENFWVVWAAFKEQIFKVCKGGGRYWYVDKVVRSYLFSQVPWKETTKGWHTLKDRDKRFLKEISQRIGHRPSVLYAVSKLLNDIGSNYIDDGVFWVSNILKTQGFANEKLEVNTIYYIENLVRKYIFENREKIKKITAVKNSVLVILDYLTEKGSVIGYMLRERIV